jgi:hypothetical protein
MNPANTLAAAWLTMSLGSLVLVGYQRQAEACHDISLAQRIRPTIRMTPAIVTIQTRATLPPSACWTVTKEASRLELD